MNTNETSSIVLVNDLGEEEVFFVLEQTKVNGTDYLLATDSEDDEADAYILKDVSADGDEMATYVMVEDENELEAIANVFRQMIDDVDLM
jgi:uncharacterized protein YrzB (UPF0473 family)